MVAQIRQKLLTSFWYRNTLNKIVWRLTGIKPLPEPILIKISDIRIYGVTRPQRVDHSDIQIYVLLYPGNVLHLSWCVQQGTIVLVNISIKEDTIPVTFTLTKFSSSAAREVVKITFSFQCIYVISSLMYHTKYLYLWHDNAFVQASVDDNWIARHSKWNLDPVNIPAPALFGNMRFQTSQSSCFTCMDYRGILLAGFPQSNNWGSRFAGPRQRRDNITSRYTWYAASTGLRHHPGCRWPGAK